MGSLSGSMASAFQTMVSPRTRGLERSGTRLKRTGGRFLSISVNSASIEPSKESVGACLPSLARTVILWVPGRAPDVSQFQEGEEDQPVISWPSRRNL